jgi:hypothetical protein
LYRHRRKLIVERRVGALLRRSSAGSQQASPGGRPGWARLDAQHPGPAATHKRLRLAVVWQGLPGLLQVACRARLRQKNRDASGRNSGPLSLLINCGTLRCKEIREQLTNLQRLDPRTPPSRARNSLVNSSFTAKMFSSVRFRNKIRGRDQGTKASMEPPPKEEPSCRSALFAVALHASQLLLLPQPVNPVHVQRSELGSKQCARRAVSHVRAPHRLQTFSATSFVRWQYGAADETPVVRQALQTSLLGRSTFRNWSDLQS